MMQILFLRLSFFVITLPSDIGQVVLVYKNVYTKNIYFSYMKNTIEFPCEQCYCIPYLYIPHFWKFEEPF